jgi:S1-C subfamily serine protease
MTKQFLAVAILIFAHTHGRCSGPDSLLGFDEALMRATVKIQSGAVIGSGFILLDPIRGLTNMGGFVLVTAAHVFADMPSTNILLSLRTEDRGAYQRCPYEIEIRKDGTNLWTQHPSADVAAMRIRLPFTSDPPRLDRSILGTEQWFKDFRIHPGDELRVLGFPYGWEANNVGFPVLRSGRIASYPITPFTNNPTFQIDFHVFPGNSGGPVYIAERRSLVDGDLSSVTIRAIVGLVSKEAKMTETVTSLNEQTIRTYQLGLGIVVPAPFIEETIARLPPYSP